MREFDLEALPPVIFADPDPAPVLARLIARYEETMGRSLYPADPERLFLSTLAYEISVLLAKLDFTARQNLPAYSSGPFADHLAGLFQVRRLSAKPASCIQRFYAAPGLGFSVIIPAGLRVTPDNRLFFALEKTLVIPAGQEYAEGQVTCLTQGEMGNGFLPGQLKTIVDPAHAPFAASTANVSPTEGGSDEEGDRRLMARTALAPEEASLAGPEGAYRSMVLKVSPLIADVAVISPAPCEIEIYPLLQGGELPDAAMLEQIRLALSPRDVRPMGDRVSVPAPEPVEYAVSGTYHIAESDRERSASIRAAVEDAGASFASWQKAALGRDILPDELIRRVRQAGAKRLVLDSPAFTVVEAYQVALATEINLAFGGFEHD
ncbi:MAG: baseplate J/gp47 family protein [Deltaproteobacteria bacterium]|jgi:phage-related baseplate assembly protein|nr:baseplate J/gp47 family protein [Deltaproteobacteria bacterium]